MKKKLFLAGLLAIALLLSACTSPQAKPTPTPAVTAQPAATAEAVSAPEESPLVTQAAQTPKPEKAEYKNISAEEAKARMDSGDPLIVLDVREDYEYAQSHVPDAVLLPLGQIKDRAGEVLPDKDAEILLYCRSGNRSRQAANLLLDMGYTRVFDFGGIINWPFDTVK